MGRIPGMTLVVSSEKILPKPRDCSKFTAFKCFQSFPSKRRIPPCSDGSRLLGPGTQIAPSLVSPNACPVECANSGCVSKTHSLSVNRAVAASPWCEPITHIDPSCVTCRRFASFKRPSSRPWESICRDPMLCIRTRLLESTKHSRPSLSVPRWERWL